MKTATEIRATAIAQGAGVQESERVDDSFVGGVPAVGGGNHEA